LFFSFIVFILLLFRLSNPLILVLMPLRLEERKVTVAAVGAVVPVSDVGALDFGDSD
jgi:hypothetical protein